jgi:hypothetical protein
MASEGGIALALEAASGRGVGEGLGFVVQVVFVEASGGEDLVVERRGEVLGKDSTGGGGDEAWVLREERLSEASIEPSVGSKGDSYDNALAETIIGLYKTEVIRHEGPWCSLKQVELATLIANARVRLLPNHSRKPVSGKPGAVHQGVDVSVFYGVEHAFDSDDIDLWDFDGTRWYGFGVGLKLF